MVHIGQAVEDRDTRMLRQQLHILLGIAAVLDAIEKTAQYLRAVLQGFFFPHLRGIGVQIRYGAALLGHRHLKSAAGAGAGLFKQQHNMLALECVPTHARPALGLQVVAQVQHIADFLRGKIHQR